MSTAVITTLATPPGPFTVIARLADDRPPVVLAAGWTDSADALLPQVAPALRPAALNAQPRIDTVTEAVIAYHAGDLHAVDDVEVEQRSGPFLTHAWKVLRTVPAGAPVSYAAFAAACGNPTAVRASATACARNAAALFVPCHRVVRTDGSLGGFRWGLDVKRWLLEHERTA